MNTKEMKDEIRKKSETVSLTLMSIIVMVIGFGAYFWDSYTKKLLDIIIAKAHTIFTFRTVVMTIGLWLAINLGIVILGSLIFGYLLNRTTQKMMNMDFSFTYYLYHVSKIPEWIDRVFNIYFNYWGVTHKDFVKNGKAKLLWEIYTDIESMYISNWYSLLLHIATVLGYIFPALYFFVRAIKRNIKHNAMSLYLELKSVEEKNMSFAK